MGKLENVKIVETLDLRNLPPPERHGRIMELWNSLKDGEAFRIINDHEPKPLYYMFSAEYTGQFEWEYEREGPEEWVFVIRKTVHAGSEKAEKVKKLLRDLKSVEDLERLKDEAEDILRNISPAELALIEQEMIHEGVSREEMKKLCDVHLEILKETLESIEINVEPGHPIHTMMEEHKMILGFLDRLKEVLESLDEAESFEDVREDVEFLIHIAEHLVEADKHHEREEDVLFPALKEHGIVEPPEIMKEEHDEMRPKKKELYETAKDWESFDYMEFRKKVRELAEYIVETLPKHIYREDRILYPLAIQTIPEDLWDELKRRCDEIGYCCFTPQH